MGVCIKSYILAALQFIDEAQKSFAKNTKAINKRLSRHFSSFHALHSSLKMDRIDYTFKFSTELVVAAFSFLLIGVNFAGASSLNSFNSNLFSKLLSYHPNRNVALYNKNTSVRTVVAQDGSIVKSASAQVVLASANYNNDNGNTDSSAAIITDNKIVGSDMGSVDKLISSQIKDYTTEPGDNLAKISAKFGISVDTIKWANNLEKDNLQPGTHLVILPVNGVLHKVTNNDTLPDIAKKFKADINTIISYNGLRDDSDINPDQLLIIPGGSITPPPAAVKAKPAIKHVLSGGRVVYEPIPSDVTDYSGGSDHLFPYGQCTWLASKLRGGVPWGGNAKQWLANASAYGAKEGMAPTPGAIVVTNENRRYGHVAIVKQVDGNRFLVTEMNYKGRGIVDDRWIEMGSGVVRGFIY